VTVTLGLLNLVLIVWGLLMAKLCPKGKAAAKRKFKVYPSAYANMYASAVCSGKVTPGGKKNRKKKADGGIVDMTRMQIM
jgi:hypothetical protein